MGLAAPQILETEATVDGYRKRHHDFLFPLELKSDLDSLRNTP
ncbi:hypothetical protein COLO4_21827 [Corchorus olitorius]|uniref:Uncharacterized protein n=1 Tax=Corchorus olitorius TaxID=93759 RepID=A0A1R3IQF2_9ROSI|nr:hypothetical protein COLO4_21827 [Corchorus olitorius]